MQKYYLITVLILGLKIPFNVNAQISASNMESSGRLSCHNDIESIMDPNSEMIQKIFVQGQKQGDIVWAYVSDGD
ncbi:MAG: hypothetical protein ACYSWZ_16545 [Planctomycetota bacterium]|jgi:hypothetical protein